jgi:hypothetical protein
MTKKKAPTKKPDALTPLERMFEEELAGVEVIRTSRNTPEVTVHHGQADRFGKMVVDPVMRDGLPAGVVVTRIKRDGEEYPIKSFIPHHNIKAYQFGTIVIGVTSNDAEHRATPPPAPVNDEEVLGSKTHNPPSPAKAKPRRRVGEPEPEIDEGAIEELEAFQAEVDQTMADHEAQEAVHHAMDEEVL